MLEIFEGETVKNLCRNFQAAVRWIGDAPVFVPFQVGRVVEVITSEHPRYRFAWAMRGRLEWRTHPRRADDVADAERRA